MTLQSPTWKFLGNYIYQFPRSFKHWYPLQIESYQSFPGVPTWTSLTQTTLVIHFSAILLRMPLAVANLVIHFPVFLSRMPLAVANLLIHLPTIISQMALAEANLVIHIPAILSRMPLAEVNLVNTLDFIYIEHDIYCNCIHQKNFKLHKCK